MVDTRGPKLVGEAGGGGGGGAEAGGGGARAERRGLPEPEEDRRMPNNTEDIVKTDVFVRKIITNLT